MFTKILVLAFVFISTSISMASAQTVPQFVAPTEKQLSQMICIPREKLIETIKKNSNAAPLFVGISNNLAVEFWRGDVPPYQQWIAFITRKDGKACVFIEGLGYGINDPYYRKPTEEDQLAIQRKLQEEEEKEHHQNDGRSQP